MLLAFSVAALISYSTDTAVARWTIQDAFGRDLGGHGVTLVDWEGHIANPAIKMMVVPGDRFLAPALVTLTADGGRLMFDLYSEFGPEGPTKVLTIDSDGEPVEFWMSIAPDRDFEDEEYTLTAEMTNSDQSRTRLTFSIRVIDQDRERGLDYKIIKDFTYDETGFFESEEIRRITSQAADDWAYFLGDQGFAEVKAGTEGSWIWEKTGFVKGRRVVNEESYTGFKIHFHGINHEAGRAGGDASNYGEEQTRNGVKTGLSRSGSVMMDTTGNWNHLGWTVNLDDDLWYKSMNMGNELHDFYSIVRHEMSHSLVFHRVHRAFDEKLDGLTFKDDALRAYIGFNPDLVGTEHFGDLVDPVSKTGVMGSEYQSEMPRARWFMTKFDLLIAQAIGYRLRETTPFMPIKPQWDGAVIDRAVGEDVNIVLSVEGGVPTYDFVVTSGSLPPGIGLDRWSGAMTGKPTEAGRFVATIEIRDNDPTTDGTKVEVTFRVRELRT